ncbi:MAG: HEXXH motif domain-containing protein [Alphaproteobacteria bacterium]|nr:HEXXH motif domain-containing protein [Alphaproteobacteria bacterium]
MSPTPDALDWAALAVPDLDGEGARVARAMANTRSGRWSGETSMGPPQPGEPTIFDGQVAVRHARERCHQHPRYLNGDLHHPNIAAGEALVALWPEGYALVREAVDTFNPILDAGIPEEAWGRARGSSSHFDKHRFGLMFATYYDPFGLAQAFVHEAAHQKLFGFGVRLDDADRILDHRPDELYESPVVLDRLRPMPAVLHAQYSFMHVTALNVTLFEQATSPEQREVARMFLTRNVERMTKGYHTLEAHARTDTVGEAFMRGFMGWSMGVLERGRALLA